VENHWKISRVWRCRPSLSVYFYINLAGTLSPKTRRALSQTIKSVKFAANHGDEKVMAKLRRIAKTKDLAAMATLLNEVGGGW
jgi:hypothetical protein